MPHRYSVLMAEARAETRAYNRAYRRDVAWELVEEAMIAAIHWQAGRFASQLLRHEEYTRRLPADLAARLAVLTKEA